MSEINLHECKKCQQKKLRVLAGRYPSNNNKYTDEHGRLWSGRTCPDCNHARLVSHMRNKRSNGQAAS